MQTEFNTIEELIEDIKQGKMVLLVDDEDRENEGDLVLAADHVTPALINFMAVEARGLICLSLSSQQIEKLRLPQMVRDDQNFSPNKTAFTVSIEASFGVSTGISAADRAHTVKVASNPDAKPTDIHMPGHIFPIKAQPGGVLKRAGHTEGSVDLAVLAGLNPAAVICEVMNADGTMARVPDLKKFAQRHKIKIGTIVDLIEYRLSREVLVEELMNAELPEQFRGFRARVFRSKLDGIEHLVLQKGEISSEQPTLLRIQVESPTKDIFSQMLSGESLAQLALNKIEKEGSGVFVLLRGAQTPSIASQVKSFCGDNPTPEMDSRDYGIGAQILRTLGIQKIKLLSNKVEKRVGLKAFDLSIDEFVSLKEDEDGQKDDQDQDSQKGTTQNRRGHFPLQ